MSHATIVGYPVGKPCPKDIHTRGELKHLSNRFNTSTEGTAVVANDPVLARVLIDQFTEGRSRIRLEYLNIKGESPVGRELW